MSNIAILQQALNITYDVIKVQDYENPSDVSSPIILDEFSIQANALDESSANYAIEKKLFLLYRDIYKYIEHKENNGRGLKSSCSGDSALLIEQPAMYLAMLISMLKQAQEENRNEIKKKEDNEKFSGIVSYLQNELVRNKNGEVIQKAIDCVNYLIATKCEKAQIGALANSEQISFPVTIKDLATSSKYIDIEKKQILIYEGIYQLLTHSSQIKNGSPITKKNLPTCFELILGLINEIARVSPRTLTAMTNNPDSNNILIYLFVLDISHHKQMLFKKHPYLQDVFLNAQSNRTKVILDFLSNYYIKHPLPSLIMCSNPGSIVSSILEAQRMYSSAVDLNAIFHNPISMWQRQLSRVSNPAYTIDEKYQIIHEALDQFKHIKETVNGGDTTELSLFSTNTFSIMDTFLQLVLSSSILAKIESLIPKGTKSLELFEKCFETFKVNFPCQLESLNKTQLIYHSTLLLMAKFQTNAFDLYSDIDTAYQQISIDLSQRYLSQFAVKDTTGACEYTANDVLGLCHSIEVLLYKVNKAAQATPPYWPLGFITEKAFWRTCGYSLRLSHFHTQAMIAMYTQFVTPVVMGLLKFNSYGEAKAYSDFVAEFHQSGLAQQAYDQLAFSSLGLMLSAFQQADYLNAFRECNSENTIIKSYTIKPEIELQDKLIKHVLNALFQACAKGLNDNNLEKISLVLEHMISIMDCGKPKDRNIYNVNLVKTKELVIAFQKITLFLFDMKESSQNHNPSSVKVNLTSQTMKSLTELLNANIYSYISILKNSIVNYLVRYAETNLARTQNPSFEQHSRMVDSLNLIMPILSIMQISDEDKENLDSAFQILQLEEKREEIRNNLINDLTKPVGAYSKKKKKKKKKKSVKNTGQQNLVKSEDNSDGDEDDISVLLSTFKINSDTQQVVKKKPYRKEPGKQDTAQHASPKTEPEKQKTSTQQAAPQATNEEEPEKEYSAKQDQVKQSSSLKIDTEIPPLEIDESLQQWQTIEKRTIKPTQETPAAKQKSKNLQAKQRSTNATSTPPASHQAPQPHMVKKTASLKSSGSNTIAPPNTPIINSPCPWRNKAKAEGEDAPSPTQISTKDFPELSSSLAHSKKTNPSKLGISEKSKSGSESALLTGDVEPPKRQEKEIGTEEQGSTSETIPAPDIKHSPLLENLSVITSELQQYICTHFNPNVFPEGDSIRREFELLNLINQAYKNYCTENNKEYFPLILAGKTVSHIYNNKLPNDWDCLFYNISLYTTQDIIKALGAEHHWKNFTCDIVGTKHQILLCKIPFNGRIVKIDISSLLPRSNQQTIRQLLFEDAAQRDILSTTYHLPMIKDEQSNEYPILNSLNLPGYTLPTGEIKSYLDDDIIEINSTLDENIKKHSRGQHNIFSDDPIRILRVIKELIEKPSNLCGSYLLAHIQILKNPIYNNSFWSSFLNKCSYTAYIQNQTLFPGSPGQLTLGQKQLSTKLNGLFSKHPEKAPFIYELLNNFGVLDGIAFSLVTQSDARNGITRDPVNFQNQLEGIKLLIRSKNIFASEVPYKTLVERTHQTPTSLSGTPLQQPPL